MVTIGRSRGASQCGPRANIIYALNQRSTQILVIKSRGRTGNCEPNMLDQMSQKLATYFQ